MNDLNRDFNGKIQTYNASLDFWYPFEPLNFLKKPVKYYIEKLNHYRKNKLVHVLPYRWDLNLVWPEDPLVNWFLYNYQSLGFDDIVLEKTDRYYELKREIGFDKFPDVLVHKNNEWVRLEIENWAHRYMYCHGSGYADLVLAYDDYYPRYRPDIPFMTLKNYFKAENIVHLSEIYHYLYFFDEEFKEDYSYASTKFLASRMRITVPW